MVNISCPNCGKRSTDTSGAGKYKCTNCGAYFINNKGISVSCKRCKTSKIKFSQQYYECNKCGRRYIIYNGKVRPYGYTQPYYYVSFSLLAGIYICILIGLFFNIANDQFINVTALFLFSAWFALFVLHALNSGVLAGRFGAFTYKDVSPKTFWFGIILYASLTIFVSVGFLLNVFKLLKK